MDETSRGGCSAVMGGAYHPTNARDVGDQHVLVATGRDNADVNR